MVSSEGHILPPHFIQQGIGLNAAGYADVLETLAMAWINLVCSRRPHAFQQESAPARKAVVTQDLMAPNQHNRITPNMWPPNSSDLSLLVYYV